MKRFLVKLEHLDRGNLVDANTLKKALDEIGWDEIGVYADITIKDLEEEEPSPPPFKQKTPRGQVTSMVEQYYSEHNEGFDVEKIIRWISDTYHTKVVHAQVTSAILQLLDTGELKREVNGLYSPEIVGMIREEASSGLIEIENVNKDICPQCGRRSLKQTTRRNGNKMMLVETCVDRNCGYKNREY